jgi:hypothetical protein
MPKEKKADAASTERRSSPVPDRREPGVPDRRSVRRGGRRAGDVVKNVAKFVHQLLTEPPG